MRDAAHQRGHTNKAGAARTTLSIDDDVLRAAKALAEARGESLGATITELARSGLRRSRKAGTRNGVRLLPVRADARAGTLEEVNRLRDELP